ncbi:MAG: type II toxin-antitoxin system VapC family toxin [Thaumarchaeota archaeon]|nr:type II toxin-antitoxin system VapC family toxin [Nitrososphaerota archaeon]
MANPRRNQEYLGLDSNVLVAYLVPDHPDHPKTKSIKEEAHSINPTVIHETYHTCVFKLKRPAKETINTLIDYMNLVQFVSSDSGASELGLKLALKHSLGGRDALILATYSRSKNVTKFVTMDKSLLELGRIVSGSKKLTIIAP